MPRAPPALGAICGDSVGAVGWRGAMRGKVLPALHAWEGLLFLLWLGAQQDVVWSGLGRVGEEGSLFIQLGVGGGERHTGPWAKPWFLEDPVSGSLPCFVSALSRALDNSAGA